MALASPLPLREFTYWMMHYRRTWRSSIVISIANPLLFFTGVGIGLGRLIDQSSSAGLHGVSYLAFLAPGLLAAAAMQTASLESATQSQMSLYSRRNYRAAAHTPLSPANILHGHLLFVAFRITTSASAVLLAMLCFGVAKSPLALLSIPAALLTGLAFATPLMALGVTIRRRETFFTIYRFVIMPLYLFSGTFVAVDQLPAAIRPVIYPLPLWHGVEVCRAVVLETPDWSGIAGHLAYLTALAAAGLAVARAAYARKLHY
ncbi:ABC transporter permease [Micromonospora sp. NPDC050417]|uniref:ABC transporter permease n=1 Tax=Micromonospora sp. NPDC050417 TaxID=3364280 RepID=UPI0037A4EC69